MLITLPWHTKAVIIGFDTFIYMVNSKTTSETQNSDMPVHNVSGMDDKTPSEILMYRTMIRIFILYILMTVVLLAPSIIVSVKNREYTNSVISNVISLLSLFTYLVIAATESLVEVEHACYCLQFCICYASFYIWQETSKNRLLFTGNFYVKNINAFAMYFFPAIFSIALMNGMHMSPYVIPITFAGEIAGVCSTVSTTSINMFINLFS
jgi:hypothetical protein